MIWLKIENQKELITRISTAFFTDDIVESTIGLKVYDYILKNLSERPHVFGYFRFRRLSLDFQNNGLPTMFECTVEFLKRCLSLLSQNSQDLNPIMLELSLEVLYSMLTYRFNLSYYDFSNDHKLEDTTTALYPQEWRQFFLDGYFLDALSGCLTQPKIKEEAKVTIVKIFSKIPSCRVSIFDSEDEIIQFRFIIKKIFTFLMEHADTERSEILEELIDYNQRAIYVHGVRKILDEADITTGWVQGINLLTERVIKNGYRINDNGFMNLLSLWKKLSRFSSYRIDTTMNSKPTVAEILNINVSIVEIFQLYLRLNFIENTSNDSFEEFNFKSPSRFKQLIITRFDAFSDFYTRSKQFTLEYSTAMLQCSDHIFSTLQVGSYY